MERITLNKDECNILAVALVDQMHIYKSQFYDIDEARKVELALLLLTDKLKKAGDDKRRYGRTSANDFYDILKRYSISVLKRKTMEEIKRIVSIPKKVRLNF